MSEASTALTEELKGGRRVGPAGRIVDIRPIPVTVPLEATLRHAIGAHWGRFVRTLVEVETDQGLVGIGEMGGAGEVADVAFTGLKSYLVGHDPFDLEAMRFKIMNPTASLYNVRNQLHAAIEFACLDIMGKATGLRVCDLLGGALRESVPFASYLFYRYPNEQTGQGGEEYPDEMAAHAADLAARYGFTTHKLKGGYFSPSHDCETLRAISEALPGHRVRLDPNAVWTVEESIEVAKRIEDLPNDYLEDPVFGMEAMRRVRDRISIPTSTNTVVTNLEQLSLCIRLDAIDVILLDTTFWGGIRGALRGGHVCDAFGVGVALHSSAELGVQLASMLHFGAVLPNFKFAGDAHYHHLVDDVITGGKMQYRDGAIAVPTEPGLGVTLDRDKVDRYHELYKELGGYHYDRDPGRPEWFGLVPNHEYAVPRPRS